MKLLITLSQCSLLGFSLIAAIKSATDSQIEMTLAFALLSLNFIINLITTRKTTERKNEDKQFNNKIESLSDQILDLKKDSKQLKSLYQKQEKFMENNQNDWQRLFDKQVHRINKLDQNSSENFQCFTQKILICQKDLTSLKYAFNKEQEITKNTCNRLESIITNLSSISHHKSEDYNSQEFQTKTKTSEENFNKKINNIFDNILGVQKNIKDLEKSFIKCQKNTENNIDDVEIIIRNIDNPKSNNRRIDSSPKKTSSCKKQIHTLENVFNKQKKFTEKRLIKFQVFIDTQKLEIDKLAKENLNNHKHKKKLNDLMNQIIDLEEYIKQFRNSMKTQQRIKKEKFTNLKEVIDEKVSVISHSTQIIKRDIENTTNNSSRNIEQEIKKSLDDFGKEISDGIQEIGKSIFDNFKNIDK